MSGPTTCAPYHLCPPAPVPPAPSSAEAAACKPAAGVPAESPKKGLATHPRSNPTQVRKLEAEVARQGTTSLIWH
jgi:hypothetical protein